MGGVPDTVVVPRHLGGMGKERKGKEKGKEGQEKNVKQVEYSQHTPGGDVTYNDLGTVLHFSQLYYTIL